MIECDVAICGAGISGLLIASELSKSYSVLVLDKAERSQCSNKFWLTTRKALEDNPELSDCIDSEWDAMEFVAYNRSKFTAKGRYVLWNTKSLEDYLVRAIDANGSKVLYKHRFYSYKATNDAIRMYASTSIIKSKLLIDCMGYSSPIVSSTKAVSILGYHHLYGRTMALNKPIVPVAVDNVIISGSPSYLEVFPKADGTAYVVLIAPARNISSLDQLEREFDFIVSGTHYSEMLSPLPRAQPLNGIVPIGKLRKRALDRILLYGEAGQVHPAASCTCLNRLLLGYKETAVNLRPKIDSEQLSAKDLANAVPRLSGFSQRFNQNLFRQMSHLTSHQGESFVELFNCLDQNSIDDLIFGEIGFTHFLQVANLCKIIKARNTLWIRPFMRTVANL